MLLSGCAWRGDCDAEFLKMCSRGGKQAMKPLMVSVCALGLLAAEAGSAAAAWNNVYQTTLFGRCRRHQTTAAYAAVPVVAAAPCTTCASPPPCAPACSTSYVQRCYYQPVQTLQTQTYYEPAHREIGRAH